MDCTHTNIVRVSESFYGNSFALFQSFVQASFALSSPQAQQHELSSSRSCASTQALLSKRKLAFQAVPQIDFGCVRGWHVKDIPSQASLRLGPLRLGCVSRDVLYRRHANFLSVTN
jgi:hypothetical protein